MTTDALWYLGRGSGVVALALVTISVALGIVNGSGRQLVGLPRFAVAAVHRNASMLAVSFLLVHIATLLFDPYAQLRLVDLVVPFFGQYQPLWLGLGTLTLDLLLAITVTSLLRQRIGLRAWRFVHWAAYATWPIALMHAIGTGSDTSQLWLWAVFALSAATVAAALIWRCAPRPVEVR